jgi:hypothetical protein
MKVQITTSGIDSVVSAMLKLQSPNVRKIAIETGSLDAIAAIQKYYNMGGSRLWENPSLPTHGAGRRKTQWWRHIPNSWNTVGASASGITLRSKGVIGFSHKVTGGTITAKRKKALTIPLIPEAHGLSAKTYSKSINRLFVVKGVLAEAYDNEKGFRAVFALKRSVTHKPWANALPPEKSYLDAFAKGALSLLIAQAELTGQK